MAYTTDAAVKGRITRYRKKVGEFPMDEEALEDLHVKGLGGDFRLILSSLDLSGCKLYGAFFEDCLFDGLNARDADLGRTTLKNCRVNNTSFTNTLLNGSTFERTVFQMVDFAGANLRYVIFNLCDFAYCTGIIDCGRRTDTYQFFLVESADVETPYYVKAGCRWYTRAEAIGHWGSPQYPFERIGNESLGRIRMGEAVARDNGWIRRWNDRRFKEDLQPGKLEDF